MHTDSPSTVAVILAAGKGTRMKSAIAKPVFPFCGKPLATYSMRAVRQAGIERVVLVVGHQAEEVEKVIGGQAEYALQAVQDGTGGALKCVEPLLAGFTGTVFVTCVDAPMISEETIAEMLRVHRENGNAATLLSIVLDDPIYYGRVIRNAGTGNVECIVEAKDATPEQLAVKEINVATYCFEAPLVFQMLKEINNDNAQGELYLTDVIELLNTHGHQVGAVIATDEDEVAGINDRVQLAKSEAYYRRLINERHMLNGVSLIDPASTFIDEDVVIGQDTVIHPFTSIAAGTTIGSNCVIGPSSQLIGATIENNVEVISSRIELSILREGAKVGPFSRLRKGCEIGAGAEVGNYSELKNTRVGAGSKVHHVGYLGDSTLGEGVNIGAGTITCNYDGKHKHPTSIGDHSFIGSGSLIVAPITIGEHALTGAGSVVTKDIPAGKVAFGVPAKVIRDRERD